ncbi:MAG: AraC family transcriptional regulator [Oscillospiraceae bacterium]|nr:AraC family transcriptional regulator [Oscillospiraceae bacterium]
MDNNTYSISINKTELPDVTDCGILTASEDFFHMDRTADFNVLICVTDGVMYVTEDGRDYEISPGEMLFLKRGLRHFGKRETLRGTSWIYAHFCLRENVADADDTLILPKKLRGLGGSVHEDKLYELCRLFHSEEPLKGFRINAMFYELLIGIGSEKLPRRESVSDKICAYLDAETDKPFKRELVEKRFYLSYSHMAAEFRREKGMSMGEYHNAARMKRACHLLRSTLMPIGEIAEALGFADMLYFSRRFHEFAGMPPTEYRKRSQKEY